MAAPPTRSFFFLFRPIIPAKKHLGKVIHLDRDIAGFIPAIAPKMQTCKYLLPAEVFTTSLVKYVQN